MAVSAEEAYYVVLRTVVAGKQANWTVMGHMAQLRQLMGVSDDLHKQYLEQINADPAVCAINGNPPPAPKRQRTTPTPAAGGSSLSRQQSKPRPRPGRSSEPGYPLQPPAPPPPTYGRPNRMAPEQDPHGLVGCRVNIIQEDDSTVEGMVVDFVPADNSHVVVVPPDETGDALPLLEYPESYQNLGLHPDYVHPNPPLSAAPLSMPPPAARPRTNSFSGLPPGGGGSAPPRAPKSRKVPTVRGAGGGGGGSSSSGASRLGPPPYSQYALDGRLAVADLQELSNMLSAISRKERSLMAELEAAGLLDAALSRSILERDALVGQVSAH